MKRVLISIMLFISTAIFFACGDKLGDDFKMVAKVLNVGDKIEVEVIEGDNAFGIYWVITADETEYFNEQGDRIAREDIEIGETIEIFYGGQVMMSYPPQIVAARIVIK